MYKNIEILNKINHKNKSIKEVKDFSFAKGLTSAPIVVSEFFEACKNYPIFFAKDKDENWFASIMLGFKENENIFIDDKGNWNKLHYIPAFVRRYPFILIDNPEQKELMVGIEKEYLLDSKEEDKNLFDKDENNNEVLNNAINFLNQFHSDSLGTKEFIKQLDEWELLEEKTATIVNDKNEQFNINGFFIVNEEKLKHLSKKRKEELCNKNLIPLITAHLISLSNIQKLGAM